jgi:hypothetical protein
MDHVNLGKSEYADHHEDRIAKILSVWSSKHAGLTPRSGCRNRALSCRISPLTDSDLHRHRTRQEDFSTIVSYNIFLLLLPVSFYVYIAFSAVL